tara:strand:+ start:2106 stop:2828 length:723 start_codon:yes stop_codon:yes gene_type:complete
MIGPQGMDLDEMMFEDPMLMQQLGLAPPMGMGMPPQDESTLSDRTGERTEARSIALIACGIILMLGWVAVPIGGLGAWFYGPIEGFFAESVYSRFEAFMCGGLFITIGVLVTSIITNSMPRVNWVENDPGIPRVTYLKKIEDTGGSLILTRRDGKKVRVAKDLASRYKAKVHVTANVLEIDARPGSEWDIEFRTTAGAMSRGQIQAEEDLAMRQGFREQQLEEIAQQYVAGQMDQIEGVQ